MDEHDWLAERFEEHRTRQLASRTRRRVHGAGTGPDADLTRRREIVDAFLAASRGGDLNALLALLDPGSYSEPIPQPCARANRASSAVRRPWPRPSRAEPAPRGRRSWTES